MTVDHLPICGTAVPERRYSAGNGRSRWRQHSLHLFRTTSSNFYLRQRVHALGPLPLRWPVTSDLLPPTFNLSLLRAVRRPAGNSLCCPVGSVPCYVRNHSPHRSECLLRRVHIFSSGRGNVPASAVAPTRTHDRCTSTEITTPTATWAETVNPRRRSRPLSPGERSPASALPGLPAPVGHVSGHPRTRLTCMECRDGARERQRDWCTGAANALSTAAMAPSTLEWMFMASHMPVICRTRAGTSCTAAR
ncbi:hypothetical protein SAMN05444920_13330 [Nonomuraea solani]|uniref:Uncharacterized protein n=1 Tax=Nonomuraea solani TaxID=1144553 RepID=A0A1H6F1T9_9ACTN|nr:hypothetical protein SAMN05444920_13330 [Nonomuraea solani]